MPSTDNPHSVRARGIPVAERTREIGHPGTASFHGFIAEDYNAKFHGDRAVRIYEEMRKSDATVHAVLTALKLPVLATERMVEPADADDPRQTEIAEFVRKNLFEELEGGLSHFIGEALSYLDFGFYYFEKVYCVKGGRIKLRKLGPRLPSAHYSWIMKSRPDVPGVTQLLPSAEGSGSADTMREIPMSKLVLFTHQKEGDNHEGVSILRSAYKHWYLKDTYYRIDGIRHERGAGIPVITLPEGSSDQDRSDAVKMGENFKLNEQAYVVKPSDGWKFEMITAGIADQTAGLMESVRHHDRMIMANILAQFLDLGAGSTGSFALSKDQSGFFTLALRSICAYMEEVINTQIVRELVDINFGPQEAYPAFAFSRVGEIDYKEMAEVVERLSRAGLVKNDPQLKVWIHKTFGLPDVTAEDFEDEEPAARPGKEPEPEAPDARRPADAGKKEEEETGGQESRAELSEKRRFRKLTLAEGRVKFAEVESFFDESQEKLEKALDAATQEQKQKLLRDAERALDSGSASAVSDISLAGSAALSGQVGEIAKETLEKGKSTAALELGAAIPVTTNFTKSLLKAKIDLFLKERSGRIEGAVKARLLNLMNNEAGKASALFDLEKLIDAQSRRANDRLVGAVVVDFFDEGRYLTFDDMREQLHGLQRSEILDSATCNMCMSIDGKTLSPSDPFAMTGQIHGNCRGIWVGVLKTDAELPEAKPLPRSLLSRFDTVDGVPTQDSFRQLEKPVVSKGSRVDQKIKDGEIEI